MIGADADELDRLAAEFRRAADELDRDGGLMTQLLNNVSWLGDVAGKFLTGWSGVQLPMIGLSTTFLREAADDLSRNAREQREASGARIGPPGRVVQIGGDPGPIATPREVSSWWRGLSDAERNRLIAADPQRIGSLDGVDFESRYAANRLNIERHIQALESAGAPASEVDFYRGFLGDERGKILLFDPSGDGRVAEVFGDLRSADDVAVIVPGIANDLPGFRPHDALALHEALGNDSATIAWLGYDAPPGVGLNADWITDRSMLSPERAQESATALARFTDGLKSVANGELTVVGHSYGTVVATEAAKIGMEVERIVLMGSPGVPADDVSVFNGADVFAVRNEGDPVPTLSVHGTDPTHPEFGATVLPGNSVNRLSTDGVIGAAVGGVVGNELASRFDNHSTYLDPGSRSLDGISDAIRSPREGPDGMIGQRIVHEDGSADKIWTTTF